MEAGDARLLLPLPMTAGAELDATQLLRLDTEC